MSLHKARQARLRILSRIRKLLRLGTSPNPHEARAANEKARCLMKKYRVTQRELEGRQAPHPGQPGYAAPNPQERHTVSPESVGQDRVVQPESGKNVVPLEDIVPPGGMGTGVVKPPDRRPGTTVVKPKGYGQNGWEFDWEDPDEEPEDDE